MSAFGYAGTIGHTQLSGMVSKAPKVTRGSPAPRWRRRSFAWTPPWRESRLSGSWVEGVTATPAELLASSRTAEKEIRNATVLGIAPPLETAVCIVGAGLAGLTVAAELRGQGCESVWLVERSASVGGVWMWHANPTSKVNSSEPSYRIGARRMANHSPHHEILSGVLSVFHQFGIATRLSLETEARSAMPRKDGASGWMVCSAQKGAVVLTKARLVTLCTNRRLGVPRDLPLRGEHSFGGAVRRGLAGDLASTSCNGKRAVVVGMGAFAVEAMRTALQRGAAHVTFLCRQRGTVCPQLVDWLNFIRPRNEQLKHPSDGDSTILERWQSMYDEAKAARPDCWSRGLMKPDGHTVSVSDLFFVAHRCRAAATRLGEVDHVVAEGVCNTADGTLIMTDLIVKCVGFEYNARIEALVGRSRMRGVGHVDEGCWIAVEAHLDSSTFHSPFGSSFLNVCQFTAKLIARNLLQPNSCLSRMLSAPHDALPTRLPASARISGYCMKDMLSSLEALAAADPDVKELLRQHVDAVTDRFNAACGIVTYVRENDKMWCGLQQLPACAGHGPWPYPMHELARSIGLELGVDASTLDKLTAPPADGTVHSSPAGHPAEDSSSGAQPLATSGRLVPQSREQLVAIVTKTVSELGTAVDDLDLALVDGGLDSFAMFELAGALLARTGVRLLGEMTDPELTLRRLISQVEQRRAALDAAVAAEAAEGSRGALSAEESSVPSSEASTRAYRNAALGTSVARGRCSPAPRLAGQVVLVLCSPRSGSSLLQLMLAAHPQLYAPQELYLLPFATMGERARHFEAVSMPWMADGLTGALVELTGRSLDECRAQVKEWGDAHETWRVYALLQQLCAPRTLVDKTPMNAEHEAFIARALDLWEAPPLVHLYRHPLAVLDSHLKMAKKMQLMATGTTSRDLDQFRGAEETWLTTNWCAAQARDRAQHCVPSLQVRYEDLVDQPEAETRRLCEMLRLPWEADMVNPYQSKAAIRSFQTAEQGGIIVGDPKLMSRTGVDKQQAASWKYLVPPFHLLRSSRSLALALGYELPDVRFVQRGEDGHTPLVAIHGYDGKATSFARLAGALPPATPLILIDHALVASGDDPSFLQAATLDEIATSLAQRLLCVLGERPFHLIGYSVGALLAHRVHAAARSHMGRPRRLALIDPPPPPEDWVADERLVPSGRGAVLDGQLAKVHEMLRLASPSSAPPSPPTLTSLSDAKAMAAALAYLNGIPPDSWPAENTSTFLDSHEVAMQLQAAMRAQVGVPFRPPPTNKPFWLGWAEQSPAHSGALLVVASARSAQFEVVEGRLSGMDGQVARPLCSVIEGRDSVERLEVCYGPILERLVLDGECSEHYACCTHCASGREAAFVSALVRVLQLDARGLDP